MSIFSFLKGRSLSQHILFALIALFLLFFIWLRLLSVFTLHNKHIEVPNYIDVNIDKIDSITESNNLRYIILDSIFDRNRPKGIVVNQDPMPFSLVKKKRRIYLTINSVESEKVLFPDIYDFSLRQAISKLENIGLEIGKLEYRPDIATNKVLDFSVNGIKIKKGQELYVGTIIDLIVGQGLSKKSVLIPNLVGLNRIEANIILKSTSLNIGSEFFAENIEDSSSAIIYKQYPVGNDENMLYIGSSIDLFFKNPKEQ